jgi:DNA polymerase-3 subunit epsilon
MNKSLHDNCIFLDIENPNARGNSICAIGILVVKDGQIYNEKYSLINPEDRFDRTNSQITGLTENMVLNSPTLPDYWRKIEAILSSGVIIGHNIKYDLSVLSKSLDRYDIEIPEFNYICTLELSQKNLLAQSYKLESLLSDINIAYEAHNALEDAYAAYYLFEYLIDRFDLKNIPINTYQYERSLKESIDSKLASNINDLYGIISGINYDGTIDDAEVQLLKKWVDQNIKYNNYALFNNIISELAIILEDGIVTNYERLKLLALVESVNSSKIYSNATLGIQILDGLLKGIVCDQAIQDAEISNLKLWLDENDYLKGVYPYDKILNAVTVVLSDGVITAEEKSYILNEFDEVLNPVTDCSAINLNNKTFCLTGDFKSGTKTEIEKIISDKGGIKKSGVSGKLDYLFVGGLGSDAWKYGNVGGKIAKAQELQEKGKNIRIISEDDLMSCLNG